MYLTVEAGEVVGAVVLLCMCESVAIDYGTLHTSPAALIKVEVLKTLLKTGNLKNPHPSNLRSALSHTFADEDCSPN